MNSLLYFREGFQKKWQIIHFLWISVFVTSCAAFRDYRSFIPRNHSRQRTERWPSPGWATRRPALTWSWRRWSRRWGRTWHRTRLVWNCLIIWHPRRWRQTIRPKTKYAGQIRPKSWKKSYSKISLTALDFGLTPPPLSAKIESKTVFFHTGFPYSSLFQHI